MGITVRSPHDGQPVKVRDQDLGRAVRDREGRIFYVLERSDGSGYYGAMTRTGSELDEKRAIEFEAKEGQREQQVASAHELVHDARGPGRPRRGKFVVLLLLLVVAALAWYVLLGPGRAWVESYSDQAPESLAPEGPEGTGYP